MSVSIRVENVGKRYQLGQLSRTAFLSDFRRRLLGREEPEDGPESFWALRDISFDVSEGDMVAVIGRNGAGKSTLLKILSSITSPTRGLIKLRGRVVSLLEVGTGFHPELTGRENVFLNGAILGMRQREVAAKFDEIVAFSGVEKFIDTPLKRYSSGMRVRLAFAVAAHLEPEILIADEVLAVGDANFQQKCLGQLGRVSQSGRTVLFVSHNAAAVASLCRRGIVLNQGRMVFQGTQTEALDHYAALNPSAFSLDGTEQARSGSGEVQINRVDLRSPEGGSIGAIHSGQDVEFWLYFKRTTDARWPALSVRLTFKTEHGTPVFVQFNELSHTSLTDKAGVLPETGAFVCRIPHLPLSPGLYVVESEVRASRRDADALDRLSPLTRFTVEKGDYFGTGELPNPRLGPSLVEGAWRRESASLVSQ
jgi:lipopolysaccharide transport system ATP-binding protein